MPSLPGVVASERGVVAGEPGVVAGELGVFADVTLRLGKTSQDKKRAGSSFRLLFADDSEVRSGSSLNQGAHITFESRH